MSGQEETSDWRHTTQVHSAVKEHFKVTYIEIIDAVHDGLTEGFDEVL